MKFNIGDRVRFLSSPGGGVVSKILSPSMVNVAIDDGFDIPTPVNDLVRIGEPGGAAARFFTDERKPKPQAAPEKEKAAPAPEPAPVADAVAADDSDRIMPLASGYRKAANPPGFYLAFVPQDQRWLITGQVDVFLVNFTDHDILFSLFIKTLKGTWRGVDYGSVPPLAMIHLESVPRDRMSLWGDGVVQLMVHPDKPRDLYNPVSVEYKVPSVKLLHEDSFRDYHFVEGRSFVYELARLESLVPVGVKGEPAEKYQAPSEPEPVKARQAEAVSYITRHRTAHREALVDLHIEAMVEDHKELDPSEMLRLQLSYFEKCLESAIADNYYKVTFIHGIGAGVLRNAIREKLKDYPQVYFQPAPIQQYGTGAMDVMITHQKEL
ncbi:MAG: DUF2027 domain-containing protein [Bacteroidales bacterium]|nr:DUF2027 domain-containing protein [Bacteroidales bacterium]